MGKPKRTIVTFPPVLPLTKGGYGDLVRTFIDGLRFNLY